MSVHAPLYCAICAVPCLLPRAEPPSERKCPSILSGTDTIDASPPTHPPSQPLPTASSPAANWRAQWHILKIAEGLSKSYTVVPPQVFSSSSSSTDSSRGQNQPRAIPIHHYCLEKVIKTIRKQLFNNGFSHEENMIMGWSLPKWAGYGSWVHPIDRGGTEFFKGEGLGGRSTMGYWCGCAGQRGRWREAVEGSHLLPCDHVSPLDVGQPVSAPMTDTDTRPPARAAQRSPLLTLPSHILVQIARQLLEDNTDIDPLAKPLINKSNLIPPSNIQNFLAFTRTSSDLYHLPLPSIVWRILTLSEVQRWRLALLRRWRANPTGTGSASQLWIALDEEGIYPVDMAFERIPSYPVSVYMRATEGDMSGGEVDDQSIYTTKDVWRWWAYGLAWRSRRRIWYCVVHACATARDADWW